MPDWEIKQPVDPGMTGIVLVLHEQVYINLMKNLRGIQAPGRIRYLKA